MAGEGGGRRAFGRAERKVPDGVERRERRRHPQRVQRVREGLPLREAGMHVPLAALRVEASVLRHDGEQRAISGRFGGRAVGGRRVVGHRAGGGGQVTLVLVHVPAAGVGLGRVGV